MKSVDDLTYLYNRLIEALKEKPYGPYKATAMIFGKSVAQRMSNQTIRGAYEFLAPPTTSTHSASTTTSTNQVKGPLKSSSQKMITFTLIAKLVIRSEGVRMCHPMLFIILIHAFIIQLPTPFPD